jgi:hypothetical protein
VVKRLIRFGEWDELLSHIRFYLKQWASLVIDPLFSADDLDRLTMPIDDA